MTPQLNRRSFLVGAVTLVAGGVLAACGRAIESISGSPSTSPIATPTATTPPATATPSATPAADLRMQIAQMLLVGFRGLTITDSSPVVADIRERGLGGVILFDRDLPSGSAERNIQSPAQVAALTAALQSAAAGSGGPLLIAVDEEGDLVQRLGPSHGFPAFESAAALGARNDPAYTQGESADMARVLRAAGVNLNLAPVADVNVNPDNPIIGSLDRSFSADPEVVAAQDRAFVDGHRSVGVRTALKHFPGHGSSTTDSHQGFVDVTSTWTEAELIPYRTLIPEGDVDTILTAHVFNANLDPDYPATLSAATITDLLRGTLGWTGLVISDDLQMAAIRSIYGTDEALARCIGAGVDVILIAQQQVWEENLVADTIERIVALVESGQVDADRIAESADRIARFKAALAG
ncbi:MAG TPA: glycoside hydrolase family 3 N-terminal domain-containing protein [Candidatus Limnocylindrales bacterium]|nr:glycoside hydrolase family 3 N-terminal domain-containing protein [Candidatus Limnocylindrales bacterium]